MSEERPTNGERPASGEPPTKYVAFLRGINVGGRKPVNMADLRAAFASLGFADVRTVQASGNVVFAVPTGESAKKDGTSMAARIEGGLERRFGYPIKVVVRSLAELEGLLASDPFRGVPTTPETRLYVTFLSDRAKGGTGILSDFPGRIPDQVDLVRLTSGEVLTAITLSGAWGTTDLMAWLDKELGPSVTTRNWNTLAKIAGARGAPARSGL